MWCIYGVVWMIRIYASTLVDVDARYWFEEAISSGASEIVL